LRQQRGYGEAEALLVRKHPECFNTFGGSLWHGRIYTTARFRDLLRPPIIYRGVFGSAGFQFLYASQPAFNLLVCTTPEYHVLVTLPLWVLSVIFPILLPLAITSLLISAAVCVVAGAQAALPRNKQRWWSRPLVGLLFFLQPIVRGWARYQGRLMRQVQPVITRQTLDSVALRDSPNSLREVQYWAEQRLDRLALVADLLRRLDQQAWPTRSDIGWSDYDVEVYDTRWSKLQLTTVAEEHPQSKQLIRCRLRARWAPRARLAFWVLCGFDLLMCGFVGPRLPWLWLLMLTLPLFVWFLHREQRNLQSMIVVFLDNLAKEWRLIKVPGPESKVQSPQSGG
jgi:hypothetical protein